MTPEDGMEIGENVILEGGTYHLPHGLQITADNVILDGGGAALVGSEQTGRGIQLVNCQNVTIRNVVLSNYYHGIYAQNCHNLTVENCKIRETAELPANSDFLSIWQTAVAAYGSGIFLEQVTDSHILYNDLQHQMNGLLAYDCQRLNVRHNLANYCSGFGFYLFETSQSVFEDNYADYCCRYQPRSGGGGHLGADAAGFVIVHRSCDNTFRRNFARLGGDGFFLAGLRPDGTWVNCADNLFEENDGSYSPNIAFEATFSSGNTYRRNKANHCNYGFWLGFSRENRLEQNQMIGNRQAGVAVENGFGMTVRGNDVRHNGHGLLLWSKHVAKFARSVPENDTSRDWLIERNRFIHNDKGVRIAADQDHGIRPLASHIPPCPTPHHHTIQHNQFVQNRVAIELESVTETAVTPNKLQQNIKDIVQVKIIVKGDT